MTAAAPAALAMPSATPGQPGGLRGVVFDLDGTLIDSLDDIADNVNFCLAARGYATHPTAAYRRFVGDGVAMLVSRVAPELSAAQQVELLADVNRRYGECCAVKTRLYPGIADLLGALRQRGVPVAVLTNKPQPITDLVLAAVADPAWFSAIVGARSDLPRKPDPAGLHLIAARLGVPVASLVMVGDSDVDVRTGQAAGCRTVGVRWGFRGEDELRAAGVDHLVDAPADVLALVVPGAGH